MTSATSNKPTPSPPAAKGSHLGRYREIATVLSRRGLVHLLHMVTNRFTPARFFRRGRPPLADTKPEEIRKALEELGTTFIKLGQILSTRPDLVTPAYQAELTKLQDTAPPVPAAEIRRVIEGSLGKPASQLFATFDDRPLAAASIGQVHAATLHDGTEVVVKVRRPHVVEKVELDLEILQSIARRAQRAWDWAERYDLEALVREFSETMKRELDYRLEARNAQRFALMFERSSDIHIPKIFSEYCTDEIITMERIRGIKIADRAALEKAGVDPHKVADAAVNAFLKMVFEEGFYHADPHPGNFFVEDGGRIGIVDFGMVGTLDPGTLEGLMGLLQAYLEDNPDRLVDALEDLGATATDSDRVALREDIAFLTEKVKTHGFDEINMAELVNDLMAVAREHYLRVPSRIAMLFKALAMAEGVGAQLDPKFNLTSRLRPYVKRFLWGDKSFKRQAGKFFQAGRDMVALTTEFPVRLRRILGDIERGGIGVNVRHAGLEDAVARIERSVNRLIVGVLAAAFVVGLAVVLAATELPGKHHWLVIFFVVGFALVVAMGLYLAWRLSHQRRR